MEQLILRQAAIDALRTCYDTETITMDNGDEYINYGDAVGEIEQLPTIQPKRGKWILDRSGAYCCSECMEPCASYVMMKPRDKFCKMCGSRNEVTE